MQWAFIFSGSDVFCSPSCVIASVICSVHLQDDWQGDKPNWDFLIMGLLDHVVGAEVVPNFRSFEETSEIWSTSILKSEQATSTIPWWVKWVSKSPKFIVNKFISTQKDIFLLLNDNLSLSLPLYSIVRLCVMVRFKCSTITAWVPSPRNALCRIKMERISLLSGKNLQHSCCYHAKFMTELFQMTLGEKLNRGPKFECKVWDQLKYSGSWKESLS